MRHISDPKVGGEEQAPTNLLVQSADLFLHLLSLRGGFLAGHGPCRQSGEKGCWVSAGSLSLQAGLGPPVTGHTQSKGREHSEVRMMRNPSSSGWF